MNHRETQAGGRKAQWVLAALLVVFSVTSVARTAAQDGSRPIKPSEALKAQVFVSLDPVPRGRQFEVAAVAEVAPGYHVQANKVLQDYLIPLTLTPDLPAGFRVVSTDYPKAHVVKFPFATQPMAVYEGKFVIRMKLEAESSAPTGPVKIPMTLRFQACNDQLCLPPTKSPLAAEFEVAAAGAATKAAHPEIFRKE